MKDCMEQSNALAVEFAVLGGDLSKLPPEGRLSYYNRLCESLGLNPLSQPFAYIRLNGALTLYARKDATDQLRRRDGVSIRVVSRSTEAGVHVVVAQATDKNGRCDESCGAVSVENLKGDALANALMKAETKAKRRATLSICGLGWLDESEIETIPGAKKVDDEPRALPAPDAWAEPKAKALAEIEAAKTLAELKDSAERLALLLPKGQTPSAIRVEVGRAYARRTVDLKAAEPATVTEVVTQ